MINDAFLHMMMHIQFGKFPKYYVVLHKKVTFLFIMWLT